MTDRGVFGLILAAGSSRRMGQIKQLMPYRDATILEAVIDAVLESSLNGLVIVASPPVGKFLSGMLPEDCYVAVNSDADSEMLTSAKLGLARIKGEFAPQPHDGVMVLLGDQPQVSGGLITTCAEAYRLPRRSPGILVATYRGRRDHPVIFSIELLEEIEAWPDDFRLNRLLKEHADLVRELSITSCPMPIDVDTPEDYQRLTRTHRST